MDSGLAGGWISGAGEEGREENRPLEEVGHVGDVDADLSTAVGKPTDVNGIVHVTARRRVNREDALRRVPQTSKE